MAFPALIPSTRTYAAAEYPNTAHPTLRGGETRVRHSNQPVGGVLGLSFLSAPPASKESVVAHYGETKGGFFSFTLPPEVFFEDDDLEAFTLADHLWIYASRPSIEDVPIPDGTPSNLYNISVELVSVPPEPVVAIGARLRITLTIEEGDAYDADSYWASWVAQNHGWYSEAYPSWWAN